MRFTNRLALTGLLITLPMALIAGCGGGGVPAPPNAFAGTYKGIYYITGGPDEGSARNFTLIVRSNGSLTNDTGSFNTTPGAVLSTGEVAINRRERDGSRTIARGQFKDKDTGTLTLSNTGGLKASVGVVSAGSPTSSFAGSYYAAGRVPNGTSTKAVFIILAVVTESGAMNFSLVDDTGAIFPLTGQSDLSSANVALSGTFQGKPITLKGKLVLTGSSTGTFETPDSTGTFRLYKS